MQDIKFAFSLSFELIKTKTCFEQGFLTERKGEILNASHTFQNLLNKYNCNLS